MALAVKNQISIWLLNDDGYEEYKTVYGDKYFLHYISMDGKVAESLNLTDSLAYLRNRILLNAPKDKRFTWAIMKRVSGGKAGAVYCYPMPDIQRDVAILEKSILDEATAWITANGCKLINVGYNPDDEKFLIITIDVTLTTET